MDHSAGAREVQNAGMSFVTTLRNGRGAVLRIAGWGATLVSLELAGEGERVGIVLGPADVERDLPSFRAAAATVGRVANRIAGSRFELNGVAYDLPANDGRHHLHGGPRGFAHVPWTFDAERSRAGQSASFRLVSADGDQGYPGRLEVSVTYTLDEEDGLAIDYVAATDRATPINLTNHAYFNLAGRGDVLGHELWMDADRYLPIDREIIPTGEIRSVNGTPFDFRVPRLIGARIADLEPEPGGYDHCLVLRAERDPLAACIRLTHRPSGRTLEVVTDQPGVQLYTGNHLRDLASTGGVRFPRFGGVCLETQHFPDSVHHPSFPSTILSPGETFRSRTVYRWRKAP